MLPTPPEPAPHRAESVAEFVEELRALKVWRGNPSVRELARRVAVLRNTRARRAGVSAVETPTASTIGHCFNVGRRRLDLGLLAELLATLGLDGAEQAEWMRAARRVHVAPSRRDPSPPPVSYDKVVSDIVRLALDHRDPDAIDMLRSVLDSIRAASAGDTARVAVLLEEHTS